MLGPVAEVQSFDQLLVYDVTIRYLDTWWQRRVPSPKPEELAVGLLRFSPVALESGGRNFEINLNYIWCFTLTKRQNVE